MKLFLLMTSIAALAACTSEQYLKDEVVEESVLKYDFVAEQNYQAVYRTILNQGQLCIKPGLTAQMVIQGELFNELRSADVTVVLYGIFSRYPHLKVTIEAISRDTTKVSVTNTLPRWDSYAKAIKTWVDNGSTACTEIH